MSAPRSLRYILLGLLQGGLIWALQQPDLLPENSLPSAWRGALQALVGLGPLLVYQSADSGWPLRRRVLIVAALGLWLLLEAYWQGITGGDTATKPRYDARGLLGLLLWPPVALALTLGWDGPRRRFDYRRLFEFAWRNALLLALAALLTGLFWATLWAGAWLLDSIGIKAVRELIAKGGFAWPASAATFGLCFAQGLARTSAIASLRRVWLGLNAWFYPLALAFGMAWVVALPFTGLDALFGTRHAAFMLLWFAVLGVKFCNAAWQDGSEAPAYPAWLRTALLWAQLCLLPVVAVAGLALQARIDQHGLSADRIWALYVALVTTLYAVGYGLSVLPRFRARGWMASVGATNTVVAMLALAGAFLLLSPVLDARRLAVQHQLARLDAGIVQPEQFDFHALVHDHGLVGHEAVERLEQRKGSERELRIAGLARTALNSPAYARDRIAAPIPADAIARLRLWPRDVALDADFVARLNAPMADWRDAQCLRHAPRCLLWRVDLDGDGQAEILMLDTGTEHVLGVYRREDAQWRHVGTYPLPASGDFDTLAGRIEAGEVKLQRARLPDLVIDGKAATFSSN